MKKRHDYATILIWAAALVTVVRYAGAFIASDVGEVQGWVSDALSLSMGLTGLGMGVLDVLGGAYIFDGWRRVMPRAGQRWPFRFRVLTVLVFGVFGTGIYILVPFTVSRVAHQEMLHVLGEGIWLWIWSGAVNIAPYLLIGGVITGNAGIVGVSSPAVAAQIGKLPERAGGDGNMGGKDGGKDEPIYRNWHEVPESEWEWIAGVSTAAVMRRYRLRVEKTARNWRHYAREALAGRLASLQMTLLSTDSSTDLETDKRTETNERTKTDMDMKVNKEAV
jgi:hypothetical protein